jgi:DNA/RNA-binding domain of Phe-tRNA-synthetase-like protein
MTVDTYLARAATLRDYAHVVRVRKCGRLRLRVADGGGCHSALSDSQLGPCVGSLLKSAEHSPRAHRRNARQDARSMAQAQVDSVQACAAALEVEFALS